MCISTIVETVNFSIEIEDDLIDGMVGLPKSLIQIRIWSNLTKLYSLPANKDYFAADQKFVSLEVVDFRIQLNATI